MRINASMTSIMAFTKRAMEVGKVMEGGKEKTQHTGHDKAFAHMPVEQ
jgi:hypothetical protein